jgi:NADH:ubiquinone oxidoreductase subunit 5 (subunit L)/multisubunit Na+/H+ antiporter MnhA subunit
MGISLSIGLNSLCFYHLLTHAVFKALLFICAGVLLGQVFHFQDMRKLSSVKKFNPLIDFVLLTRILALSGFPFLAGFFSKDLIIERRGGSLYSIIISSVVLFSLPLTVWYSSRIVFYIWGSGVSGHKYYLSLNKTVSSSLIFLFLSSLCLGKLLSSLFCKKNFETYGFKAVIIIFLLVGVCPLLFNQGKLYSWLFSKIFFCESKKTTV